MSKRIDSWFERMCARPTLDRNGPWLLKFSTSDTRVWVNELNKRKVAKRERLFKGHWRVEAELVNGKWRKVIQ